MDLTNKRILITAGPTWVSIDKVRVISNQASGETGLLLAEALIKLGAKVTLALGPVDASGINSKIELIRFRFFDELKNLVSKELKLKKYDIIIHAAAVSDYRLKKQYASKIKSGLRSLRLELIPTPKIIDSLKKISPNSLVVGFKFEPGVSNALMINRSRDLLKRSKLDLVVGNTISAGNYRAFLIDHSDIIGPYLKKKDMAKGLISLMEKKIWIN